jgi:hypothetical protein
MYASRNQAFTEQLLQECGPHANFCLEFVIGRDVYDGPRIELSIGLALDVERSLLLPELVEKLGA